MKLENLIAEYQRIGSDELFETIYRTIEKEVRFDQRNYEETVAASIGASVHEAREIFDDCVMYTVGNFDNTKTFLPFFRWKFRNMRSNFLRDRKTITKREVYASQTDDTAMSPLEIADNFNIEEFVTHTKEADQKELIDFLVRGENERTTAIVQTYLTTDLDGPTAIGQHIGIHHEQVKRALHRLAAKYNSKQFGMHQDYLVAL